MTAPVEVWEAFVAACAPAFTQPSFTLFGDLLRAWALCPGRHTVTHMLGMLGPAPRRKHDAYHRFLRAGAWSMAALWRLLAQALVAGLAGAPDDLLLDLDDTLFHKTGRKVESAGVFRDAVRSVKSHVVYALGLNLVVMTLRVSAPWGGEPLGLPINMRVYRKNGPSHLDLALQMLREVMVWFPGRVIRLCADGAYSSLAGRVPEGVIFTSRLRRDAALYEITLPRRRHGRGRPRTKGARLPAPEEMAGRARKWTLAVIDFRGRPKERLIYTRMVLWYRVCPDRPVKLVIVRDPAGKEPDDFFFTTEAEAAGQDVVGGYCGRWSIEDTFRNTKQYLGGEDPQTWKGQGPERAAALSLWIYAAVWYWYITVHGAKPVWVRTPWYTAKNTPSFADALGALRRELWGRSIYARSDVRPQVRKMADILIGALAGAT